MNALDNHVGGDLDGDHRADLDDRIRDLLTHVGDAAPPAPDFTDLHAAPSPSARPRLLAAAAAAALVAIGIGGVIVISGDDPDPEDRAPANQPTTVASPPAPAPAVDLGVSGPLLTTEIDRSAVPMLELPGWETTYAYSDENLPLSGGFEDAVAVVGEGPTYDAPLFAATTVNGEEFGGTFPQDVLADGEQVEVGDVTGSLSVQETDGDSGPVGPIVLLFVPAGDGELIRFNAVRIAPGDVVEMASAYLGTVSAGTTMDFAPEGFRRLDMPDHDEHATIATRFRSPDGSEIEINGENRGHASLLGRIGGEVRTTRTIDGVEVAERPSPDGSGRFWVDWKLGDWSFYAMADNFATEADFLDALRGIEIVESLTPGATAGGAPLVSPANRSEVVDALLVDVPVPPGFDAAPLRAANGSRDRYQEIARVSSAVACGWLDVWFDAQDSGDSAAAQTATDALATSHDWAMLLEIEDQGGWSSVLWETADAVNGESGVSSGDGPVPPTREGTGSGLGCAFA